MLVVALGALAWSIAHRPETLVVANEFIAVEEVIVVDESQDEFEAMCDEMENCR